MTPEPQQSPAPGLSASQRDFFVRFASAIVLIPFVVLIAYFGGWVFILGVAVMGILVFSEWCRIAGGPAGPLSGLLFSITIGATALAVGTQHLAIGLALLALAMLVALVVGSVRRPARWIAAGIAYSGLACISLIVLRQSEGGISQIYFLLVVVWATDTAAYMVGRTIGGPKLWPSISPKKTWSGSIGGLVFGSAAGIAFTVISGADLDTRTFGLAVLLSIATQVGDLFESAFKRMFSVKDSGNLIPGHGGILDRLDGLLAAAMVAAAFWAVEANLFHLTPGLKAGLQ
ncbi:MAG: phosphatidate cytidylyltransferase [Pseudomonadota bacterium]